MALAAVAAAGFTMAIPRAVTARGDVLVVARTTQLALDQRFVDRDATMYTNALNQRQALIDLATSVGLEIRVAEQLGLSSYQPGALLGRITLTSRSDLLRIEATGATAEEAERLAKAWASTYETFVNEIYSGTSTSLDAPLTEAQQRYDQFQVDLGAFYANGELVRAQQAIARYEGLLAGSTAAQLNHYTEYVTRTQQLNLILDDARSIQAQYEGGGLSDLGTRVEALIVRARIAGADQLPFFLNLDSAGVAATSDATVVNLVEFIRVLEAERDRRLAEAETAAASLAAGNGAAIGLPPDVRARYEAELATARSILSKAEGEEKRLLLQRDLALRAVEVLQGKRNERAIDQVVPEVSVRFVGASTQPSPSILVRLILNLAAAVAVSLALTIAFIVGRELLRPASRVGSGARTPPERVIDTPTATD
jgi:hypothetical protein